MGLDALIEELDKDSPPNLPTLDSEVAESHLLSPSENYTTYSQLVCRIANVMDLAVDQPAVEEVDRSTKILLKTSFLLFAWPLFHPC